MLGAWWCPPDFPAGTAKPRDEQRLLLSGTLHPWCWTPRYQIHLTQGNTGAGSLD